MKNPPKWWRMGLDKSSLRTPARKGTFSRSFGRTIYFVTYEYKDPWNTPHIEPALRDILIHTNTTVVTSAKQGVVLCIFDSNYGHVISITRGLDQNPKKNKQTKQSYKKTDKKITKTPGELHLLSSRDCCEIFWTTETRKTCTTQTIQKKKKRNSPANKHHSETSAQPLWLWLHDIKQIPPTTNCTETIMEVGQEKHP